MVVSRQTPDQKAYIEESLPLFSQHLADGNLKTAFWPDFFDEWFKRWPLQEPSAELIEKEGTVEKANKAERGKQMNVSSFYA